MLIFSTIWICCLSWFVQPKVNVLLRSQYWHKECCANSISALHDLIFEKFPSVFLFRLSFFHCFCCSDHSTATEGNICNTCYYKHWAAYLLGFFFFSRYQLLTAAVISSSTLSNETKFFNFILRFSGCVRILFSYLFFIKYSMSCWFCYSILRLFWL